MIESKYEYNYKFNNNNAESVSGYIREIKLSLEKVLESGHGKIEITVVNHEVVDIVETIRKRIK
jgi:hypothetical protein